MPKGNTGEDRAKVKFRVIEFELEGGNAAVENSIRTLTTAITQSTSPTPQRLLPPRQPKELSAPSTPESGTDDRGEHFEVVDAKLSEPNDDDSKAAKTPKTKYKPPLPNYLHDLDMQGNGVPFTEYAAQKAPTKQTRRYLVAALWLKEHGASPTISVDKVYTCYKTAGWPLALTDWDVNFRSLVKTDRFRRVETGDYAITPLGEADVQKG